MLPPSVVGIGGRISSVLVDYSARMMNGCDEQILALTFFDRDGSKVFKIGVDDLSTWGARSEQVMIPEGEHIVGVRALINDCKKFTDLSFQLGRFE